MNVMLVSLPVAPPAIALDHDNLDPDRPIADPLAPATDQVDLTGARIKSAGWNRSLGWNRSRWKHTSPRGRGHDRVRLNAANRLSTRTSGNLGRWKRGM